MYLNSARHCVYIFSRSSCFFFSVHKYTHDNTLDYIHKGLTNLSVLITGMKREYLNVKGKIPLIFFIRGGVRVIWTSRKHSKSKMLWVFFFHVFGGFLLIWDSYRKSRVGESEWRAGKSQKRTNVLPGHPKDLNVWMCLSLPARI